VIVDRVVLASKHIVTSTFPPFRFPEFVLGVLIAVGVQDRRIRWAPPSWIAAGFVVAYLAIVRVSTPVPRTFVVVVPVFALALVIARLALCDIGGRRGLLATAPARHLGEVSYAFYLVQLAPIALIRLLVGRGPVGFWAITMWVGA
jgi:peptidoglycan/LPS O-acetylase OafA/YrhL